MNLMEEEVDELLHLLHTATEERENKTEELHGAFTGTSLYFGLYGEQNDWIRCRTGESM